VSAVPRAVHESELPRAPSFRLDGRRALVTGAGRGLGRAAAAALAEAGAHVVLVSRTRAELEQVAGAIREAGGSAAPLALDVTDVAATQGAIEAEAPFDVLINNAGTNRPAPFLEVTLEDYDAVTDLNLRAAFFVAQGAARRMVEAGIKGSIVNVSSQMGHVGGENRTVYCATKHALEGLTKAMAIDLAPHGIRVNSLGPTFLLTPMTEPFFAKPEFRAKTLARIPLGRLGAVEDLMGAILFLASDASSLMTGSALTIDGGWTAQ
jgi:NAD(P)-dependent dehydrogenase (short-subunit alcohol dehydrogenase family)